MPLAEYVSSEGTWCTFQHALRAISEILRKKLFLISESTSRFLGLSIRFLAGDSPLNTKLNIQTKYENLKI